MSNNIHGWLILDKPLGISSAHAVAYVKRLLQAEKIGHAGTLDPLASGVLPLALNEATKTVSYAMDRQKAYRFTLSFGQERDTGDAEGRVVAESAVLPSEAEVRAILPRFTGIIMQAPPAYSAVKIGGNRAYALARAGEAVVPEERPVWVDSIQLIDYNENSCDFTVQCGKGMYVRALACDLARALGTLGYVSALRRTRSMGFAEADAISLENLEEMVHKGGLAPVLLLEQILQPVESALDDILAWEVNSTLAQKLRHGQAIPVSEGSGMVQVRHNGKLIALCSVAQGLMTPVRVFNL